MHVATPDLINGAFEALGGLMQVQNCRRIWRDRVVRGVDWRVFIFFTSWGYWNLFYYPDLHQWLSFAGGIVIVLGNTVWVASAMYLARQPYVAEHYHADAAKPGR